MLTALALAACGRIVTFDGVHLPEDGLPRGVPDEALRRRLEAADAWSTDHGGLAFVAVRGAEVVYESTAPRRLPTEAHHLFSGTKTFGCLLVQAARFQGDLGSLDEPVGDAFPALLSPEGAPTDPRRARITVRHLLQFTSGLRDDRSRLTGDGLHAEQDVPDKPLWAASRPLDHEPGTTFTYGSAHLWVLSGWFRARTGQDPIGYLDQHVFAPIGFEHAEWLRDPSGNPALAYGAGTTAGQWAKVGMLLRDDGVWQGERLLAPGAVAECATGSEVNPAYGLTMWLNRATPADLAPVGHTLAEPGQPILWPDGPADLFVAAGAQDQRLYVVPSEDLVIARLGSGSRRFRDAELLARALGGRAP